MVTNSKASSRRIAVITRKIKGIALGRREKDSAYKKCARDPNADSVAPVDGGHEGAARRLEYKGIAVPVTAADHVVGAYAAVARPPRRAVPWCAVIASVGGLFHFSRWAAASSASSMFRTRLPLAARCNSTRLTPDRAASSRHCSAGASTESRVLAGFRAWWPVLKTAVAGFARGPL
jgi:hypothetical protein